MHCRKDSHAVRLYTHLVYMGFEYSIVSSAWLLTAICKLLLSIVIRFPHPLLSSTIRLLLKVAILLDIIMQAY